MGFTKRGSDGPLLLLLLGLLGLQRHRGFMWDGRVCGHEVGAVVIVVMPTSLDEGRGM